MLNTKKGTTIFNWNNRLLISKIIYLYKFLDSVSISNIFRLFSCQTARKITILIGLLSHHIAWFEGATNKFQIKSKKQTLTYYRKCPLFITNGIIIIEQDKKKLNKNWFNYARNYTKQNHSKSCTSRSLFTIHTFLKLYLEPHTKNELRY